MKCFTAAFALVALALVASTAQAAVVPAPVPTAVDSSSAILVPSSDIIIPSSEIIMASSTGIYIPSTMIIVTETGSAAPTAVPTKTSSPGPIDTGDNDDLTWLWIVLGVGGGAVLAGGAFYFYKKNDAAAAAAGAGAGGKNFFRYEDGAADVPGEGLEMDEQQPYRTESPTKRKYEAMV